MLVCSSARLLVCTLALITFCAGLAPRAAGQAPLKLLEVATLLDTPSYVTTFPGNEELLVLYRGSKLAGHQGRYFYGHFGATEVISIDPANATSTVAPFRVNHTTELGMHQPTSNPLFEQTDLRLLSGTWEGEPLLIQIDSASPSILDNGTIYMVVEQ